MDIEHVCHYCAHSEGVLCFCKCKQRLEDIKNNCEKPNNELGCNYFETDFWLLEDMEEEN